MQKLKTTIKCNQRHKKKWEKGQTPGAINRRSAPNQNRFLMFLKCIFNGIFKKGVQGPLGPSPG